MRHVNVLKAFKVFKAFKALLHWPPCSPPAASFCHIWASAQGPRHAAEGLLATLWSEVVGTVPHPARCGADVLAARMCTPPAPCRRRRCRRRRRRCHREMHASRYAHSSKALTACAPWPGNPSCSPVSDAMSKASIAAVVATAAAAAADVVGDPGAGPCVSSLGRGVGCPPVGARRVHRLWWRNATTSSAVKALLQPRHLPRQDAHPAGCGICFLLKLLNLLNLALPAKRTRFHRMDDCT